MKQIKLSGREMAVLRAIDYAVGSTGEEIRDRTNIEGIDVADILNGLCDVGYVEAIPDCKLVTLENYGASRFEVNPSYWQQLKEAMRRR
jgi:DNA-binding MarR family transcriptional regulator